MDTYNLSFPDTAIDAILATGYELQNAGYIFLGVASEQIGTPSERSWVLAGEGETGHGFTSPIPKGYIGVCVFDGTSWTGKLVKCVSIDSTPTPGSTNAVSSGGVYASINQLATDVAEGLNNMQFTDVTPPADEYTQLKLKLTTTNSGIERIITYLTFLSATTSKAGLMSSEDKAKVDSFLANLRSLTFADTTASADQGTQITETLKATIGGVQEVIDSITLLAATSSKAGLLSASDKAYIDTLPSALTSLSNSISGALALMESLVGYYVCDTAAATAAKTVTANGYTLTNGGCIRIKMTNANTAANVTLNINSTGAKALYYNGTQASSSNSWEAGEVLEVYYDGTQYQCASGGGGGKFATGENVKDVSITDTLDNSESLIESAPVKTAIDGITANIGYYECSTGADVAAKTVAAMGYSLIVGGCIRIKMTYANSADNVTLNVNSIGAAALYYNGNPVSASNTWGNGEVIDVYYDGTNYQATPSQTPIIDTEQIDKLVDQFAGMLPDDYTLPGDLGSYWHAANDKQTYATYAAYLIDLSEHDECYVELSDCPDTTWNNYCFWETYYGTTGKCNLLSSTLDGNKRTIDITDGDIVKLYITGMKNAAPMGVAINPKVNVAEKFAQIDENTADIEAIKTDITIGSSVGLGNPSLSNNTWSVNPIVINRVFPSGGVLKNLTLNSALTESEFNASSIIVGVPNEDMSSWNLTSYSLQKYTYVQGGTIPVNITLPAGSYVGISSSRKPWSNVTNPQYGTPPFYGGANMTPQTTAQEIGYGFDVLENISGVNETIGELASGMVEDMAVSYKDAVMVLMLGTSLTYGAYYSHSTSWQDRLNDILDINIATFGISGGNYLSIFNLIAQSTNLGNKIGDINAFRPDYIMVRSSANATPQGLPAIPQLEQFLEACGSVGAEMILGNEEGSFIGSYQSAANFERSCKSFAKNHGLKFSPMMYTQLKCYKTHTYAGFWGGGHGNWRVSAGYSKDIELLSTLPLTKSVKMFKVRPMYKNGSPAVTDLVYDTNEQRLRYFTATAPGANGGTMPARNDNLDSANYAPAGGPDNVGTSNSESALMRLGYSSTISFSKFALVEFILPVINVKNCFVSLTCSVQPQNVYVAITKSSQTMQTTDTIRTTWLSVPFTYSNGIINVNIARSAPDIQLYDKVRVLVSCEGDFYAGKPTLIPSDGDKKNENVKIFHYREEGEELNGNVSFDSELGDTSTWTLSGNATIGILPVPVNQYTDYTTAQCHLELPDNEASASKTITIPSGVKKVAIRVIAQHYIPVQTTRAAANAYITDSVVVANFDYIFGTIRIVVNGTFVAERTVWSGWQELYLEYELYDYENSVTIELIRHNYVDASLPNSDRVMMIHAVSVQAIP